jgi:hypothetical protein
LLFRPAARGHQSSLPGHSIPSSYHKVYAGRRASSFPMCDRGSETETCRLFNPPMYFRTITTSCYNHLERLVAASLQQACPTDTPSSQNFAPNDIPGRLLLSLSLCEHVGYLSAPPTQRAAVRTQGGWGSYSLGLKVYLGRGYVSCFQIWFIWILIIENPGDRANGFSTSPLLGQTESLREGTQRGLLAGISQPDLNQTQGHRFLLKCDAVILLRMIGLSTPPASCKLIGVVFRWSIGASVSFSVCFLVSTHSQTLALTLYSYM